MESVHDATGENERDRDDLHGREEDRPQIVQLKEDDLSEEQVMQKVKEDNEALESEFVCSNAKATSNSFAEKLIEEGKITFKKPTKRKTEEEESAEASDKKQSKQQKFEKKNPTAGTQNTRLLSFGEDEEEEED